MFFTFAKDRYKNFKLFWESYLPTTEFKITGPTGTIFWILSGILRSEFAIIALAIHAVPIVHHYARNRPFGIEFSFVPTQYPDGDPNLISADEGEAILENGTCTIFARVSVSTSISSFALQFDSGDNVLVELRDIPKPEHVYQKKKNILSAEDLASRKFHIALDVFRYDQNPTERDVLKIKDHNSGNTISEIELI